MSRRSVLWGIVAVLLVATALRLFAFGEVPPGLYHDEAYHGLDALDILQGNLQLYFPANNGREPLFIYLIALAVGLLGRSPFALRLPSFFVGLLTIAATAALGRVLFSRRVGLLAGAVLAVTLWHVHLSRVGFRAVLAPLFIALTAWQAALGCKGAGRQRGGARHWVAAGVFYGLSFYTYTAARFTPVALVILGIYALATKPATRNTRYVIRGLSLAALTILVTVAPLAAYTIAHPDVVLGRPGQVYFLNPAIHGGDLWGTLTAHTLRTLEMFFVRGDRIWRHNVPWRPIFDPVLGVAFVLGVAVALRRARRDVATGFVLVWTAVMSLPTLLAEDAPHFLRGVGVLPVVVLLPALGLDWLLRVGESASRRVSEAARRRGSESAIERGGGAVRCFVILVLPLLFGLGSTTWAYFGDYARDPMTGYWFEHGAVSLAGRVNEFLGLGWDGERMLVLSAVEGSVGAEKQGGGGAGATRHVYLDPRLWDDWQPQLRFLVAAPEAVTQIQNPESEVRNPSVAVFAWPYEDWRWAWSLLPTPAEVTVEEGPLSQGDRQSEPYTTYLAFFATPPDQAVPVRANFSGGVELLGAEVTPVDRGRLRVRLRWRATAPLMKDYVVFLHYLRDGERIAQADSRPAGGHYPTTLWHPGDVINDDHYLDGVGSPIPSRDTLLFGLWQPESGAKLYLLDEAGNPAGDWMVTPVGTPP